jgi:phosphohistidine phosphatase SixA
MHVNNYICQCSLNISVNKQLYSFTTKISCKTIGVLGHNPSISNNVLPQHGCTHLHIEEEQDTNVMTSTIHLFGSLACTLFNS